MSKIAIVTDSNSGITQAQAKELSIAVIPMPFIVKEKDYLEDVNLTQKEFYALLEGDDDIGTSQPSPETVMSTWRTLLTEYDEIVHIPMSSGLSGSCQSAMIFAQEPEFDGKVFVVNNQRISVTQRQSVLDAIELAKSGKSGAQIKDLLEQDKFNSSIYIMLDTLYYLKRGGRITPAAAALGTLLRLKPVLTIQGEKLDAFAKARTSAQGKNIMLNALKNDIDTRFGGITEEKNLWLAIAHTNNEEAAEKFAEEMAELYPGYPIHIAPLSLSIACHIGPGALAVAVCKKIGS